MTKPFAEFGNAYCSRFYRQLPICGGPLEFSKPYHQMKIFAIPTSVRFLHKCERLHCIGHFRILASCYEAKFEIPICLCVIAWDIYGHRALGRKGPCDCIREMGDSGVEWRRGCGRKSFNDQDPRSSCRRPGERVCTGYVT